MTDSNTVSVRQALKACGIIGKQKKSRIEKYIDYFIENRNKKIYEYVDRRIKEEIKKLLEDTIEELVCDKFEEARDEFKYQQSDAEILRRNNSNCNYDSCSECSNFYECPFI